MILRRVSPLSLSSLSLIGGVSPSLSSRELRHATPRDVIAPPIFLQISQFFAFDDERYSSEERYGIRTVSRPGTGFEDPSSDLNTVNIFYFFQDCC